MQANLEIKKYLEENGITQIFISRKTGIEASKLSLALNGDRKLTLDEYALICGVLGVSADKFLKPRLPDQRVMEMKSEKTITVTLEMEEVMNEACELVDLLKKANSLSNELAEKLKSLKINIEV